MRQTQPLPTSLQAWSSLARLQLPAPRLRLQVTTHRHVQWLQRQTHHLQTCFASRKPGKPALGGEELRLDAARVVWGKGRKVELRHGKQFVLSTTPSHLVACKHAVSDFDRNTNRSTPVVVQTSSYDLVEPACGHEYGLVTPFAMVEAA